jgi:hypothetical protein
MSQSSFFLDLPYIQPAQAQKHVTHNEGMRKLDTVVQLMVLDSDRTVPPSGAVDGDRHIVAENATGDWLGHDMAIALFDGGAWHFEAPWTGWRAWVTGRTTLAVFDGSAWIEPFKSLAGIDQFGLNATPSAAVPFVVRAPAALWDAVDVASGGTDGVIQSINRVVDTADAGLALQTGYVTNALFGFFGGTDLRLSVSADGSSFLDSILIDPASGIAQQPQRPRFKGYTNYDNTMAVNAWVKIAINQAEANDQAAFDTSTNLFTAPVDGTYLFGGSIVFRKDASNDVRIQIRLVRNGVDEINGSFLETDASPSDDRSGVQTQTMAALMAGDTVELQGLYRKNAGFALADKTSFWGVLMA